MSLQEREDLVILVLKKNLLAEILLMVLLLLMKKWAMLKVIMLQGGVGVGIKLPIN